MKRYVFYNRFIVFDADKRWLCLKLYRFDRVTGILDDIGMLEHLLYSRMCMFVCQLALQARIAAFESKTASFSADDRVRELEERVAEQDKRFAIVKERVDADRKAIVVSQTKEPYIHGDF